MMTTEGWTDVMFNGMDVVGVDKQPKTNNQAYYCLYFILFMIVGFLFLMNLFVGVIIDNFNKIKEQKEVGGIFVTDSQRNWIEIQHIMLSKTLIKKQYPPKNRIRKFFFRIMNHKYFEVFIISCIFLNTIVMAMRYARMSANYELAIEVVNYICSGIFNLEMIVKVFAMSHKYFTESAWNRFDFIIVIGTDVGFIMNIANFGIDISTTATVIRGFRIMRIFRLLKSYGRVVLDTLMNIIPQITNIMAMIFLLLFIYSVLGISLFADVKYGNYYNSDNNFRTFPKSIILLFRCMTGEDWNLIMDDLVNTSN